MPDLSLETLPFLLALMVPGFVWSRVHRYLQVGGPPSDESWLDVLTLSAINFALWSPWIPKLWVEGAQALATARDPAGRPMLGWFVVVFVSPAGLGVLTGMAHRRSWVRDLLLSRLKIEVPRPFTSAWDYVFGEHARRSPLWATITLSDGSTVEGYFARDSVASTGPVPRDLFLEQVYERDGSGRLRRIRGSSGVWIAASSIRTIEFRRVATERRQR